MCFTYMGIIECQAFVVVVVHASSELSACTLTRRRDISTTSQSQHLLEHRACISTHIRR